MLVHEGAKADFYNRMVFHYYLSLEITPFLDTFHAVSLC